MRIPNREQPGCDWITAPGMMDAWEDLLLCLSEMFGLLSLMMVLNKLENVACVCCFVQATECQGGGEYSGHACEGSVCPSFSWWICSKAFPRERERLHLLQAGVCWKTGRVPSLHGRLIKEGGEQWHKLQSQNLREACIQFRDSLIADARWPVVPKGTKQIQNVDDHNHCLLRWGNWIVLLSGNVESILV